MPTIFKPPCDEGVILSGPDAKPCSKATARWVLAATILGSGMAFIDGAVVNVALPVMQKELNATIGQAQWIVESYALFLSALILVGGALGDRFGRRKIFGWGVAIFAAASVCCGLSADTAQLILARSVQGVGGALMVPGSLALISASFSSGQRGRAIGIWSGFASISAGLGPLLGGWLVQHLSWRWAFFINIPLAAVVLAIVFFRLPESRDEDSPPGLDLLGAILATAGLGGIVYGLIESSSLGLGNPRIVITLSIGTAALAAFFANEARGKNPMVPLELFKSKTFSGANLLTLLLYAAMSGILFYYPFDLIQVQGYTTSQTGAAFLPFILTMFFLSRWSGGLLDRYGARLPLIAGPIIAAIGFALFAVPGIGGSYWTTFFPAMTTLGLGMAISAPPLTAVVMGAVPRQHAGVASGINNAISRAAGLIAIAVLNIFMLRTFQANLDERLAAIGTPAEAQQLILGQVAKLAAIALPPDLDAAARQALQRAIDEAFVGGFRVVIYICVALALASALSAWLLVEPEPEPDRAKARGPVGEVG